MQANPLCIQDLHDLRDYVQKTLCEYNELEIGAFQMTERILIRSSSPCGILFCLHGPRNVRLLAIWETDRNSILFYGSSGERQHRSQLINAPRLVAEATAMS